MWGGAGGGGRYHLKVTTYNTDHAGITPHSLVGIVGWGRYHLKVTTYNTDHAVITPHSLVGIVGGGGGDTTLKSLPITQTTLLSHHIA